MSFGPYHSTGLAQYAQLATDGHGEPPQLVCCGGSGVGR